MGINRDKPDLWKDDICQSVDLYNSWFMEFAPQAFRTTRISTARKVENALSQTDYLLNLSVDTLRIHPEVLPILRMSTCPPIARDRLIGLAGVRKSLVDNMEDEENPRVSPRMPLDTLHEQLNKIRAIITRMTDPDIFTWVRENKRPTPQEVQRASTIIADRLCGAVADPIIRNAQEKRQLKAISEFLSRKGYSIAEEGTRYNQMLPGTFSFHTNVPVRVAENAENFVNIPVDVVIMPFTAEDTSLPILIEAKSAGDFANVNKRRKEEATKMQQLRQTYGTNVSYNLFLCGYFDSGYLGYEAAEGIDWIWEHRMSDLEQLGI